AQGGGLAGAVGSEQAEHLAAFDAEGQILDGVPVGGAGVALAQAGDLQRHVGECGVGSAGAPAGRGAAAAGEDQDEGDGGCGERQPPHPGGQGCRGGADAGRGRHREVALQRDGVLRGGGRGGVGQVGGGEDQAQPVAPLDFVVDGGEGEPDVLALLGVLDPDGGDQLGGQYLLPSVRADVVDLGEQDGVLAGGGHADGGRRRAGDAQVLAERGGVEAGVLAGEVQGDADAEGGQPGQPAGLAESGEGGDGGRARPGRIVEGLLASGERDLAGSAVQAGVAVGARAAQLGLSVGGVDASGAGDAEGGPGVRALLALEVTVEPGPHAVLDAGGLHVAAVV